MTAEQLLRVASEILRKHPRSTIERNAVGNLAIVDGGEYIGWVDVRDGEIHDLPQDYPQ